MNSFLLWIGGLMVAVLGVLFAAPLVIDWNSYRGVLEEEATRVLGRDVRVGGRVDLRLLPAPYVRFEKIRISDAGASLGEPFFRAESFTMWLALAPLLRGALEASELEIDQPVLRLAVDAEGRGNWQALRISPGAMPFMPSEVVLQQVRIKQGMVSLKTPAPEPLALSGINGDISADSLTGPYRFRGTVDWYGSPREIRIGTSQREADGQLRYKASVRAPHNGNVYMLDGALSELSPSATHTAALSAKIPLANIFSHLSQTRRQGTPRGADLIELTAALTGDLYSLRIENMAFAFEQDGKPQLLTGASTANWRNGMRMETRLASKWLDLDQMAGQLSSQLAGPLSGQPAPTSDQDAATAYKAAHAAPLPIVRSLIGQVSSVLPSDGSSLLTVDVEQVNLGGTALSGVRLAIARAGGLTSIGELKASLPGNARGELRGTLSAPREANSEEGFDGELILRGGSYQRFATWIGASALLPAEDVQGGMRVDAPFSLASKLVLTPGRMQLSNSSLELAGRRANADVDWTFAGKRRLDVQVEGRAIDIRTFAPGSLKAVPDAGTPAADNARATGFPLLARTAERIATIERHVGDLKLRLRTAELSDADVVLKDVETDLTVVDGRLTISTLKAATASGARVELQGELRGLTDPRDSRQVNSPDARASRGEGNVRGWISASTPEGIASLTELVPETARTMTGPWLRGASRLDSSFNIDLGGKNSDRIAVSANGAVDGVEHKLALKLDGGWSGWKQAPVAFSLTLDGNARSMIRNILWEGASRSQTSRREADEGRPARLEIDVSGATVASMVASARLDLSGRASTIYRGRSAIGEDGSVELEGVLDIRAPNATDALAFALGRNRLEIGNIAMSGTVDVSRKWGTTSLASSNLTVGSAKISGEAAINQGPAKTRIEASLKSTSIDITAMLGMLLDGTKDQTATAPGDALWPDKSFELSTLDELEGRIAIASPLMTLSRGLSLSDTEAKFALGNGKIELSSLTGSALGGRLTARSLIERAPAGANVSVDLRMTEAGISQLATPSRAGDRTPAGTFNVTLSGTGKGLTPHAAIAALTGKGEIEIRNGQLTGLSPAVVERVAEAVIDKPAEITRELIQSLLTQELSRGHLDLGSRKLAIEMSEGAARIAPLEITAEEGTLKNSTTIELVTLKADSEWQIIPRRGWAPRDSKRKREPLPQLTLVWTGPLSTIARQPPRMSTDPLERDLSIRKLEREAERLEEIRRQDEERARLEAERLRRLQEQPDPASAPGGAIPPPQLPSAQVPSSAPVIQAPFPIRSPSPTPRDEKSDQQRSPTPRVQRPPARAPEPAQPR